MQVCTSLQTDNYASTPPLSFLQAGCPSCRPTNSIKALKALQCQNIEVKKADTSEYGRKQAKINQQQARGANMHTQTDR